MKRDDVNKDRKALEQNILHYQQCLSQDVKLKNNIRITKEISKLEDNKINRNYLLYFPLFIEVCAKLIDMHYAYRNHPYHSVCVRIIK